MTCSKTQFATIIDIDTGIEPDSAIFLVATDGSSITFSIRGELDITVFGTYNILVTEENEIDTSDYY